MKKIWGTLAVATLALTGCGGASAQPAASVATSAAASPSPTQSATSAVASQIGESVCEDPAGDSTSPAVDLERVRLLSDGKLMFVTFSMVAAVPTSGTVLYSISAYSADGQKGYEIGAKFQNGKEIANFIFDSTSSKQENITNRAVAADKQVSMRYPIPSLKNLGESFTWRATVSLNGSDVDKCPAGTDNNKFPGA